MKTNDTEDAFFRAKFQSIFGPSGAEREFRESHKAFTAPPRLGSLRKGAKKHEIRAAAAEDSRIRERYFAAFNGAVVTPPH